MTNYMKILKYILQHRYIFKILAIITIAITLIYTINVKKESIYNDTEKEFRGVVYKKKQSDDKTILYINAKEKLVINDYYNLSENIKIGDEIIVSGNLKKPNNNTVPNLFNYKKYLYYNDIFYTVTATKIIKTANNPQDISFCNC